MAPTEATREGAIMLLDMCAFDLSDRRLLLVHEACERDEFDGVERVATGAVLSLALDARRVACESFAVRRHAHRTPDSERYRISCAEGAAMLRNGEAVARL